MRKGNPITKTDEIHEKVISQVAIPKQLRKRNLLQMKQFSIKNQLPTVDKKLAQRTLALKNNRTQMITTNLVSVDTAKFNIKIPLLGSFSSRIVLD